ncbi:kinetochore complex sim4 subunit fta1 domain-containing protein [Sarocladium implicatum]|nr:kinetochore complex sim4 subunit fta1 domain-containing protein [Sarocladium implicatum]
MARLSGAGPEASQQPSQSPERSVSVEQANPNEDDVPPFFNTTFSTHRVSPLYKGPRELDVARLDELASRLRDTLVGDVVRGVQIGLESTQTAVGQVGPLRQIKIRWFQATDVLGDAAPDQPARDARKGKKRAAKTRKERDISTEKGLWIHIKHENAAYNALLLPAGQRSLASGWATNTDDNDEQANDDHFVRLPLLLLRMPQPLKIVISEWLTSTFDCRVSKVALGTRTLVNIWEAWIQEMGILSKGPDFVVTLAFSLPAHLRKEEKEGSDSEDELNQDDTEVVIAEPGLKSIDITINPQDLRRFVRAGEDLRPLKGQKKQSWETDPRERRVLAGPNADDGWAWRTPTTANEHPFTEALGRYLDHHLALDMFHPGVRVVQISCGGFVLAQNRLKLVKLAGDIGETLSRAAWGFVMKLGERVAGEDLPEIFASTGT